MLVVLRALGLGDFLTGVPALRALADAYPEHRRVLVAPQAIAPLAELTGAVDDVVDTAPLAPSLRGPNIAVNLHGKGPQSHRVLLAARPRRLVSFANPNVPESADGPPWRAGEHEVHRWCRLLEAYGIPADPNRLDLDLPSEILASAPEEARGATLVHPGAASAARRWPAERWIEVARSEAANGRSVIVTGGSEEADLGRSVVRAARLPDSATRAGRTDLLELAALVALANHVVCGDTGVAHMATALGTPSVVLFGPTSPSEWGPPPERPWHRVLWAGGMGDPHADIPDAGLLSIQVRQVLEALDVLPQASPSSAAGSR
ncbi:MAG: glycosyltransferase family 9 protein [Actinomycetota bacterium]|nr:glycosyltransferase family 9 protein [Actinomycetota bacterium]